MAKYYPAGGQTYNLGSSISSTQTSILLSSFLEPVTGTPYTMALLNTDIAFGTIQPKSASSEFISFTGITQNDNGSATLTGVTRGLAKKYPFTTDNAYKLPHSGQSIFILSDVPQVFQEYVSIVNDQTVAGIKTFSSSPVVPTGGTGTQAANNQDIANAITGASGTASTTTFGTVKISVNPATPLTPIAAGDNDPRIPTQDENDALVGTSGTPSLTNKYVTNDDTSTTFAVGKVVRANGSGKIDSSFLTGTSAIKFGGTGADGALAITSGATNIDLAGATVVIKNYTSISITGTGSLTFSNPNAGGTVIILKSQGAVTLTSSAAPMIDASGMGAAAGVGVSGDNDGTDGTVALNIFGGDASQGVKGLKRSNSTPSNQGAAYTILPIYTVNSDKINIRRSLYLTAGSGGGGGGSGNPNGGTVIGGNGGRGGGGLIIECGGALNFTTANGISVAGKNGSNGGTTITAGAGSGGGGGGAGGFALVLYNSLTAASGTITVSGGNGGNGSIGIDSVGNGGAGGGGGGMYGGVAGHGGKGATGGGASDAGTNGSNSATSGAGAGTGGTGTAGGSYNGGGGGGGGTAGEYIVALNNVFV